MCKHENFVAHVDVQRIKSDRDETIVAFYAEVHINCAECDVPMVFRGLPMGLSQAHPTGDLLSETATLPVYPKNEDPMFGLGVPGFHVKQYTSGPDPERN